MYIHSVYEFFTYALFTFKSLSNLVTRQEISNIVFTDKLLKVFAEGKDYILRKSSFFTIRHCLLHLYLLLSLSFIRKSYI